MRHTITDLVLLLIAPASLLLAACGETTAREDGMPTGECRDIGPAPANLEAAESVVYRNASARPLRLHVIRPDRTGTEAPSVLLYFGGGWRTGSIKALEAQARRFAENGFIAVLVDYRVKCRDDTDPLDATEDAQAAYAWWRDNGARWGADPDRIVLAGGSAGGQLALATAMLAATDSTPPALVLFNPAVDLVGPAPFYLKPFARTISPAALPLDHLPPTLILHGTADRRVPIDTVRNFCRRAVKAGRSCRIVSYRGMEHGFYHQRESSSALGRSPFESTMARALAFLDDVPDLDDSPQS